MMPLPPISLPVSFCLTTADLSPAMAADAASPLQLPEADRRTEPHVLPPPDKAKNALLQFRLPPGFVTTLWTAAGLAPDEVIRRPA